MELERQAKMTSTKPTMTKKCFDGTLKFHHTNLELFKKYRPADVENVKKAIESLKNLYPQYAEEK